MLSPWLQEGNLGISLLVKICESFNIWDCVMKIAIFGWIWLYVLKLYKCETSLLGGREPYKSKD
jgi:hypothetical protein